MSCFSPRCFMIYLLLKENSIRRERSGIKRSFALITTRKGTLSTNVFFIFPHLKSNDGNTRQEKRDKYLIDGYMGKCKAKVMNAIWDVDSNDDNIDFDKEATRYQEINFALMVSSGMELKTIIVNKNITDSITIKLLRKIVESMKPKTQSITIVCIQTSTSTFLK
jgi:hypothetical protein